MKNLFDITGRVVVITGGAGILGRSICEYLAEQGAKVVILDRDEEAGNTLADKIGKNGGEAMFLATDVLNRDVLVRNREAILAKYGCIDIRHCTTYPTARYGASRRSRNARKRLPMPASYGRWSRASPCTNISRPGRVISVNISKTTSSRYAIWQPAA